MKLAILGATSKIAKELILSFNKDSDKYILFLFSRDIDGVDEWILNNKIKQEKNISKAYKDFDKESYDVILNFVGVGNPLRLKKMGHEILDISHKFDQIAINYLKKNKLTKYLFISSGAVYGTHNFEQNVKEFSMASININSSDPQEYYSMSKLYAELLHRSMNESFIVDIRIFNYISQNIDLNSGFLISDAITVSYTHLTLPTILLV